MKAADYFMQGFSCSESIVREAIDLGLCDETLLPVATSFSGGIGSGCLCGAISGALIVLGNNYGRGNKFGNDVTAKQLGKEFISAFKERFPVTCCRVLSKGYEMGSIERKKHCQQFVKCCSELLQEVLKQKV